MPSQFSADRPIASQSLRFVTATVFFCAAVFFAKALTTL